MTKQQKSSRKRMANRLGKHGKLGSTNRTIKRWNLKQYGKKLTVRRQAG